MCGFFAFSTGLSAREISDMFELDNLPHNLEDIQSLKFYPKSIVPTVSKNSPNQIKLRRWSLVPRWWKGELAELKFSTFNARMEELRDKASYRTPWQQSQRCLIPVSWFYEFETVEIEGQKKPKKLPYQVSVKDNDIFAIAGLYETWKDKEGKTVESCTMITCESVLPLRQIHNRQPVIIEKNNWDKWMDKKSDLEEMYYLLKPSRDLQLDKIPQIPVNEV